MMTRQEATDILDRAIQFFVPHPDDPFDMDVLEDMKIVWFALDCPGVPGTVYMYARTEQIIGEAAVNACMFYGAACRRNSEVGEKCGGTP